MSDTLRAWIEAMADDEEVEAVVIGRVGGDYYYEDKTRDYMADDIPDYVDRPHERVLTWAEAAPLLDYEFDAGFGGPACEAIYAWTRSWVIFISEYDGSTSPCRIPRNPYPCSPTMPGG